MKILVQEVKRIKQKGNVEETRSANSLFVNVFIHIKKTSQACFGMIWMCVDND